MKIELHHARGLRIAIDGKLPQTKEWGYGTEEGVIEFSNDATLEFPAKAGGVLKLKSIDLGVDLDELDDGLTTGVIKQIEATFLNPDGTHSQVVMPLVKEATDTYVTTVDGEREHVDEITLYQLFDSEGVIPEADPAESDVAQEWTVTLRVSAKTYREVEEAINELEPLSYKIEPVKPKE